MKTFGQDRVESHLNEIMRRAKAQHDYVVPRSKLSVEVGQGGLALVVANGSEHRYPIQRQAVAQLLSSTDVPVKFADRLESRGHLDLVAATLTELLSREDKTEKGEPRKHLIRILDDQARAVLSDRFNPGLANDEILALAIEGAAKFGAEVWDFKVSNTAFRINLIAPGLREKVTHAMPGNGAHAWAKLGGDFHNAACQISNSETGHGRFQGDISSWREVCSNFAVMEKSIAKVHLGKQLEATENLILSDETRVLDQKALASRVNDMLAAAFDPVRFKALVAALSATTARAIGDQVTASDVVEEVVKVFALPAERTESILESFLKNGRSQFFLGNALTEMASPDHAKELSDEARTAFETAGGSMLSLGDKDWKNFLAQAYATKKNEEKASERATQTVTRVR